MNIQSKLQYKTNRLKRKLYDNAIEKKALDIRAIRLDIEEDRYGNKEHTLVDHGVVDLVIEIPGQSLQYFQGQRASNNDAYNQVLSVYSLIPIKAWPKTTSRLNKDDLIIFKYLDGNYDDENPIVHIQVFQVAGIIGKGTTSIHFQELTLSPYNFNIDEYPEIKQIIEDYKLEPIEF